MPRSDLRRYIDEQLDAARRNLVADLHALARTCDQEARRLEHGGTLPSSASFAPFNQQLENVSNMAARGWALRVLRQEVQ